MNLKFSEVCSAFGVGTVNETISQIHPPSLQSSETSKKVVAVHLLIQREAVPSGIIQFTLCAKASL